MNKLSMLLKLAIVRAPEPVAALWFAGRRKVVDGRKIDAKARKLRPGVPWHHPSYDRAELLEHFSLPSATAEEVQLVVQTTGSDEPKRRTLRNLRSDGLTPAIVLAARELID